MLTIFLVILLTLYLIQVGIFIYGISHPRDRRTNKEKPFVSIVIAARNEELNLGGCLDSVLRQSYPRYKYEVIVVNDHSTDRTNEICLSYAKRYNNISIVIPDKSGEIKGKTNALIHGIDAAKGEIILITDADCTVPQKWIEATMSLYTPGVGIVGGMTLQKARNGFEGIQSLDWAYLLGLASAAVNLRNPLSTIGNNLSFRRSAYEEVGGYRKIQFSITEDYALFQAIIKTGKWDYYYPIDPELVVTSEPCPTVRDLIRQKQRWGKGGLEMKPIVFFIMAIGFLTHALIATAFLVGDIALAGTALLVKLTSDYMFLYKVLHKIDRVSELKYFYRFELYYFLYVLLLPFIVFFGGKVIWKGRSF